MPDVQANTYLGRRAPNNQGYTASTTVWATPLKQHLRYDAS